MQVSKSSKTTRWITSSLVFLFALQWLSFAEASHFRHGSIAWAPTDSYTNTIRFTFRLAFRRSYSSSYNCDNSVIQSGSLLGSGNSWTSQCLNYYGIDSQCNSRRISDTGFRCTDYSSLEDWSMGENNFTYSFPSIHEEWTVSYTSCCWISLSRYGNSNWLVSAVVNLTRRSDTGRINSSPVSRSPAIIRWQEGCPQSIRIATEDPDGDVVRCRWATYSESSKYLDSFPYGILNEMTCVLAYNGSSGTAGTYAAALTLEDFPTGTINFGGVSPFSAVGLQFLVIISGQHGSCSDVPVFTASAPNDGECSEVQIGSAYKAVIEVTLADLSKHIAEIVTSSPSGMQFTSLRYHRGVYYKNVTWYPNQQQVGQQLFCFKAVDSMRLESEWRCVTILVGLSNTPRVIMGSQMPANPISKVGAGFIWWSIQFDRVIKKPRSSSFIRLVLLPSGHTVYKVDTLSAYVSISSDHTTLQFAMPNAALSMNGSYAILIDQGAVVGQGCSYDGPPTPGIISPSYWNFTVNGVCPIGYYLAPPEFANCVDINECGSHSRSKRNLHYLWWSSSRSFSNFTYSFYSSSSALSSSTQLSTNAITPATASASLPFTVSPSANYSTSSVIHISPTSAMTAAAASSIYIPASECLNHAFLEDSVRGQGFYNGYYGYYQCDSGLPFGWYRFRGAAGTQMPISCVGKNRCSSHAPGWLNTSHPSVADGIVSGRVCFHWSSSCCHWSSNIRVRNCSGFYVYELGPPPACWLRYCGNGGANYLTSTAIRISPTPVVAMTTVAVGSIYTPASVQLSTATALILPSLSASHIVSPAPFPMSSSRYQAPSSSVALPTPLDFQLHVPADCAQICKNNPGSYSCSCVSGYRLASDGKSCSDINECLTNNGGCSHHCYNIPGSFYCGCPKGTTMAGNNLTCVEPGVSVTCAESNMTVSLEKQTFPFFEVSKLHLRYSSCRATQNSTHLIIETPLSGCGTQVNETQDALIFWNEIRVDAVIIDNVITRTHDVKLPFYCRYSRKEMLSLSFKPRNVYFGQEVGYGNFTFKLDFYETAAFAKAYTNKDYPIDVRLNDYIYVRYSVESSADLVIMAENCRATKDGSFYSWPQYNIIQNGCPRDTTMDYSYDPTRHFQQFKLRTFRFFNDYDTVYFHCELLACHRYSPNSRCRKSCLNSKKRKRRDVTRDSLEHGESTSKTILTGGPIRITEKFKTKDDGQKNNQKALIGGVAAAGGLGVLAIIALVVLSIKYHIARRIMDRNKVADLYTTQGEQMGRRNAYIQEDDTVEKEDSF